MPLFEITVRITQTETGTQTFEVEAPTLPAAEEIAKEQALVFDVVDCSDHDVSEIEVDVQNHECTGFDPEE